MVRSILNNAMPNVDAEKIAAHYAAVREKVDMAAAKSGRRGHDITLVAISKTYPVEAVEAAVAAGATDIGESRIQEAADKIERFSGIARWHLVGHLQSNKAARAVALFDLIQSVDSTRIAEKISIQAQNQGKPQACLIEVNSSGEESKFGFSPETVLADAEKINALPGITVRGLMTIGPWTDNQGCIKAAFDATRNLFELMTDRLGTDCRILSMGMSSDYELAIECGSTMVRVGTAIFGQRDYT